MKKERLNRTCKKQVSVESMKAGFGSREDVHVLRRALGSEVVMSKEEGEAK